MSQHLGPIIYLYIFEQDGDGHGIEPVTRPMIALEGVTGCGRTKGAHFLPKTGLTGNG